jgi:hypothetical protein
MWKEEFGSLNAECGKKNAEVVMRNAEMGRQRAWGKGHSVKGKAGKHSNSFMSKLTANIECDR